MERIFVLGKKERLTAIMLLWLWWGERNSTREEGKRRSASEIAYIVAFQADAFLKTRPEKLLSENGQRKTWQKPPVGFLKLNSDGSFFSDEKTGGWGFIIRDKNGEVIKAAAGKEDCILDAFHAELLGVQAGLRMAINLGITRLYIETDASLVKEAVEGGEYRLAAMGGIVTEIKAPFASLIIHFFQLVFLAGTMFFSHKKSAGTVFRLVF